MSSPARFDNGSSRWIDITGPLENIGRNQISATKDDAVTTEYIGAHAASPTISAQRLPLPAGVDTRRIYWPAAMWVIGYHLFALLAFVPWFFSWTGVVVAV